MGNATTIKKRGGSVQENGRVLKRSFRENEGEIKTCKGKRKKVGPLFPIVTKKGEKTINVNEMGVLARKNYSP